MLEHIRVALNKCVAELTQVILGREPDAAKLAQALDDLHIIRQQLGSKKNAVEY